MARSKHEQTRRAGASRRPGLSKAWTWSVLLAVVVGFAAYLSAPRWRPLLGPAPAPGALTELGAVVYRDNCAACHGRNAEGQVPGRPMGGALLDGTFIAPALNGTGHMWHHPPDQLVQIVKHGSPDPKSPMRGFEGRLSDREIHAVIAYLQSLWPERLRRGYHGMHGRG